MDWKLEKDVMSEGFLLGTFNERDLSKHNIGSIEEIAHPEGCAYNYFVKEDFNAQDYIKETGTIKDDTESSSYFNDEFDIDKILPRKASFSRKSILSLKNFDDGMFDLKASEVSRLNMG
jgi:hypothetical protein